MGDGAFNDATLSPPAPNINDTTLTTTAETDTSPNSIEKTNKNSVTTQQQITKWLNNSSTTKGVETLSKAFKASFKTLTKHNHINIELDTTMDHDKSVENTNYDNITNNINNNNNNNNNNNDSNTNNINNTNNTNNTDNTNNIN
jgi:hypothetical protein